MIEKLLIKASQDGMKSIAFPALGTGTIGFPRDLVARIMLDSAFKFSKANSNTTTKEINFVTFHLDKETVTSFQNEFRNKSKGSSATESVTNNDSSTNYSISSGAVGGNPQPKVRRGARKSQSGDTLASESRSEDVLLAVELGPLSIELVSGDITNESTDAIVVIGDEGLNFGGAVGRAIARNEGGSFEKKLKKCRPQKPGTTEFIITQNLSARLIAHLVPQSPSYKDMMKSTYQMLVDAEKVELKSISIPAIGSGVLSFSPQKSASVILQSIAKLYMSHHKSFLQRVRIVIYEERMLATFADELTTILASPETYFEEFDTEKGIIDWLKEKGVSALKTVKNFFSSSHNATKSPGYERRETGISAKRNAHVFDDVTLIIYSNDLKKIQKAKKKIEKMVEDNITPLKTQKPAFAKLSETQKTRIKEKAKQLDVSVTFDGDGTLTIVGYHEDTSMIMNYCHEVVLEKLEAESELEKGNLMAEIVQWYEVGKDGKRGFDPETNMQIELAYINQQKRLELELLDDSGKKYKCDLELEELTMKTKSGTCFTLERVRKGSGKVQLKLNLFAIFFYLHQRGRKYPKKAPLTKGKSLNS